METRGLLFVLALAACSGAVAERSAVPLAPVEGGEPDPLAVDADPDMLRPCQTLIAGQELVEIRCGEYRIVEFRKETTVGESPVLDVVTGLMQQRFGELKEERGKATIDGAEVALAEFSGSQPGAEVSGLALALGNSEGRFWGLACYRKQEGADSGWCRQAVQVVARAGGLSFVGAAPAPRPFGSAVTFPDDCVEEALRVRCSKGEVSIMKPDGRDPALVQKETRERLAELAKQEGASLQEADPACTLLGESATCKELAIVDQETGERLRFLLVRPGDGSLLVCSFSAASGDDAIPAPCSTLLEVQ
jgi:hypothetical protein